MKHLRHITSVLIIILIAVLAAGTIVEKLHGSDFARIHVYGAWWFVALWALMALLIVYMAVKCKTWKRLAVCALHSSILFILLGALLTMLTGQHGKMKLEPNRPDGHFFIEEKGGEITKEALPFSLTLDRFEIETYPNSKKPKDYVSYLKLTDGETQQDIHRSHLGQRFVGQLLVVGSEGGLGTHHLIHLRRAAARKDLDNLPEAFVFPHQRHPCHPKCGHHLFRREFAFGRSTCI